MYPPESICPLRAYVLGALCPPNLACVMEEQEGACSPFRQDEGSWSWSKGKGQQGQHLWNSPLANRWLRLRLRTHYVYTQSPSGIASRRGGIKSLASPSPTGTSSPLAGTKASGVATFPMGAAELGSTAGNDKGLTWLEKRRWWEKAGGRPGQDASGPHRHSKWLLC